MTPASLVGGPFCGLPAPRTFTGAFAGGIGATYEFRGGDWHYRGDRVNRCPGCGAYVRLPASDDCPLCGAALGRTPNDA